jgi:hypothetical protein
MSTPTQAPYEIARYLSDEAKRAAVARSYSPIRTDDLYLCPRCASGMCPLGVAVLVMAGKMIPTPGPHSLAVAIGEPLAWNAADRFAEDWDKGYITDLAVALGLQARARGEASDGE